MIVKKINDKLYSTTIRGSVGSSQHFGSIYFGDALFGSSNDEFGIYQKRYKKRNKKGGEQYVKMIFYRPTDPKTPAQLAQRQKMKNCIETYKTLINQGKSEAIKSLRFNEKRGFHAFVCLFLRNDPILNNIITQN